MWGALPPFHKHNFMA